MPCCHSLGSPSTSAVNSPEKSCEVHHAGPQPHHKCLWTCLQVQALGDCRTVAKAMTDTNYGRISSINGLVLFQLPPREGTLTQ